MRALRGPIGIGLFLLFAVYFGKSNLSGVFSLFAMEKFAYGTTEIGGLLMIMGLGYALVQGAAVGPLTRRFGENAIITACTAGSALGFPALLFAPHFVALAAALSAPESACVIECPVERTAWYNRAQIRLRNVGHKPRLWRVR